MVTKPIQRTTPTKTTGTKFTNGAPPGVNTFSCVLNVSNVEEALAFYQRIGFEVVQTLPGPNGPVWAALRFGNSQIQVQDIDSAHGGDPQREKQQRKGPVGLGCAFYLYVPNVETVYADVTTEGVETDTTCQEEFWGDRTFTLQDPFGYCWTFATHIREVSPEEMMTAAAHH